MKKSIWKLSLFLVAFGLFFSSCQEYDEKAIAVAGTYDATIQGGLYNFDMVISLDGNDNVLIEGLFDDYDWEIIRADLDNQGNFTIDFDIFDQNVYYGARLWGDGIWRDGFLQLDYKIDWGSDVIRYRLVAQQY